MKREFKQLSRQNRVALPTMTSAWKGTWEIQPDITNICTTLQKQVWEYVANTRSSTRWNRRAYCLGVKLIILARWDKMRRAEARRDEVEDFICFVCLTQLWSVLGCQTYFQIRLIDVVRRERKKGGRKLKDRFTSRQSRPLFCIRS